MGRVRVAPGRAVVKTLALGFLGASEFSEFEPGASGKYRTDIKDRIPPTGGPDKQWIREEARLANPVKRLVVRADDFGMCHAVNTGTLKGFKEGIVTQTSMMAPCPWFPEAAAIVRQSRIPAGLHMTLTCEWDFLRWRPLTDGPSLAGEDGTMYRTVEEVRRGVTRDDAVRELLAQARRASLEGVHLGYLDWHMGDGAHEAYAEVSATLGLPMATPGQAASFPFTSRAELSARNADEKKSWMLDYVRDLPDGTHLLICHLATAGPEIASMTGPDSVPYRWAEEYRKSDLEVITDPDVREAIARSGIELTSIQALTA